MSSESNSSPWSCKGPNEFLLTMRKLHPTMKVSERLVWDNISVTRGDQELGSLYMLRQCLQLWEDEMEKWGCNGLGEELGQK